MTIAFGSLVMYADDWGVGLKRRGKIMAAEKGKARDLQEVREVKPAAKSGTLMEGEDFSSLKALLVKIEKQKEAKKK